MFRPYRSLLSRPGALAFSGTGLLARLPMSMAGIGIVLLVVAQYGSYGLAGRVSAVYVLTQALIAPRISRLVDRHGQALVIRPAIAVSSAGLAGLVVAATTQAPVGWLYATAVVTGAAMPSFGSFVRARWSHQLSSPRDLHSAYSLESAFDEVVFVVGPILATTLAASVNPQAGLLVALGGMLVGGYWFLALRGTQPPPVAAVVGAPRARSVLRSTGMVSISLVFVGIGVIFGATDVSTVAFAQEHGRPELAGLVLGVFAAGSMVSGLLYGARHWATPLWRRFVVGSLALGAGVSLFVLVSSMPMLAAVMFVTGLAIAPTIINGNALVQALVPRARLTEGLTILNTMMGVGVSVGASLAGLAIDARGSSGGFLLVVGAAAFVVVTTLVALPTLRTEHVDPTQDADDDVDAGSVDAGSVEPGGVDLGDVGPDDVWRTA